MIDGSGEEKPDSEGSLESSLKSSLTTKFIEEDLSEFKKKVDLYDLFEDLMKTGFSYSDIGLLYVYSIRALPKKSRLSSYKTTEEKTKRNLKASFEKDVREFFKKVRNNAVRRGIPTEHITLMYNESEPLTETRHATIEGTIEGFIDLCSYHHEQEGMYEKIGLAVISGSKEYLREKPNRLGCYKTFLEYNRIFTKLSDLLESEKNEFLKREGLKG